MAKDDVREPAESAESPTLAELQRAALRFREARSWQPYHNPKDLVLALVAEAGELAELVLWKDPAELAQQLRRPEAREAFADELADQLNVLLLLADSASIDLAAAFAHKLEKNERKYPVELARGNAKKWTEL